MKIRDLAPHARPREKLIERGLSSLRDSELVAIILRTGYKDTSSLELAEKLLKAHSLAELAELDPASLAAHKGIGASRAAALQAAFELSKRVRTEQALPIIRVPQDILYLVQDILYKKQEHLIALYLDARHQLIKRQILTIGTVNASLIHPREVFAPAIELRASAIILAHNHPSGDTMPSEEDIAVTEKVVEVGRVMDIPIFDHVIVGPSSWTSLRQQQLI